MLLYNLITTLKNSFAIGICTDFEKYLKAKGKEFLKLDVTDKTYYIKYGLQLSECLMNYYEDFTGVELNLDPDHDIEHDLRLVWDSDEERVIHISLNHASIKIQNVIPDKLMRICNYKGNTNICKEYRKEYSRLAKRAYEKIRANEKYSELSHKTKSKVIFVPFSDLLVNTLAKKRKCAKPLYSHLFSECDRVVFKLYKNRFTMYDFEKEMSTVDSFRMKLSTDNTIMINFNNGTKFQLVLQTNASKIKEHLSLKFHTQFKNMDELFAVHTCTI
ncbi:Hypothetical protein MVR_LOCUS317 [uncultured virus]|nr:Hypothetical protein MVR_LOCUS317 [uncultured virus]